MTDNNTVYNFLNEVVGISTEALNLVFGINGYSKETAISILYYFTGFNSFDSYCEELGIELPIF